MEMFRRENQAETAVKNSKINLKSGPKFETGGKNFGYECPKSEGRVAKICGAAGENFGTGDGGAKNLHTQAKNLKKP